MQQLQQQRAESFLLTFSLVTRLDPFGSDWSEQHCRPSFQQQQQQWAESVLLTSSLAKSIDCLGLDWSGQQKRAESFSFTLSRIKSLIALGLDQQARQAAATTIMGQELLAHIQPHQDLQFLSLELGLATAGLSGSSSNNK